MDRSITIDMRRRKPGESVAPMREAAFAAVCLPIRRRLLRWADDVTEQATSIEPTFPSGLRDRAQDDWSSLLVIAQLAGPAWMERAHRSALVLSGGEESNDDSPAVQLLEDCRFNDVGGEVISYATLVTRAVHVREVGLHYCVVAFEPARLRFVRFRSRVELCAFQPAALQTPSRMRASQADSGPGSFQKSFRNHSQSLKDAGALSQA